MRPLANLFLLALLLPASGCCSLARLFCGPDKSEWVSVDFQTPQRTVKTLVEAFRRDDPEIVYLCLSDGFRKANNIDDLGSKLAWQKMKEQNPGLHLAGYATVPVPTSTGPDHAECTLDVEGITVFLRLVRQSRWQVRFRLPDGNSEEQGRTREPGDLTGLAEVAVLEDDDEDASKITLAPMTFFHDSLDEVPLKDIEYAGISRLWKVEALRVSQ